jgi:transcription antitermination factor NusG
MSAMATAVVTSTTAVEAERWYVARTMSRHEKKVAELLTARQIDYCLPVYESLHRWSDRTVRISSPLFPGYVFLHMDYRDRRRALELPGVVDFVKFGDKPAELSAAEAANMQILGKSVTNAEPFPYLQIGRRVRVATGPFAGLEGVLKKKKGVDRLVISVHEIQRSVLVEISGAEVDPVCF